MRSGIRRVGSGITAPGSGITAPGSGITAPGSGITAPRSGITSHGIRDHSPGIRDHSPGIRDHSPRIRDHSPRIRDHSPGIRDHSPGIRDHSPGIRDHRPCDRDQSFFFCFGGWLISEEIRIRNVQSPASAIDNLLANFIFSTLLSTSLPEQKWRRGGLVVSALDFRSRSRCFEPGHCRRAVSLDKKLYFTLSLFTQVYKWVLAIMITE